MTAKWPIVNDNRYCDMLHVVARQIFAKQRGFVLSETFVTPPKIGWLLEKFIPLLTGRMTARFTVHKSEDEALLREGLARSFKSYYDQDRSHFGRLIELYTRTFNNFLNDFLGGKGSNLFDNYMRELGLPFKTIREYLSTMCLLSQVIGSMVDYRLDHPF